MRGNFATDVVEKLGKKNHGKGVKVELANEDIIVDLYVVMYFGVAIPVVAKDSRQYSPSTLYNDRT